MIIYAIPGLGTNEKLFVNTIIKKHEVVVLKWPVTNENDTMMSYAKKFISQIDQSKPYCLLGVSFGGMICTELSKLIKPYKIFLISSSKTRAELPWFIKAIKCFSLYKLISEKYYRILAYHSKWFIGFGNSYKTEFCEMVNSMAKNYFKNSIRMIINWNGKYFGENIIHIHGTHDRLLKYRCVKSNYVIKNGSHAMIFFNAPEINLIIEKELSSV